MIRAAIAAALLFIGLAQPAQAQSWIQFATCGTPPRTLPVGSPATIGVDTTGSLCISGTIAATLTFPTIGAAVPATGIYNGINVGGTLRGVTGLSLGSTFSQTVAIVDASGNQITSFGGATTIANGADVALGATTDAACATDNGTCTLVALTKRNNQNLTSGTLATGTAGVPAAAVLSVQNPVSEPCQNVAKTYTPISITTATTTRIVAPTAAKRTYICYMLLTSAAADNVAIVEGTGGTCGSGTAGVIGGTTAANGPNFAANGGFSIGNGAAAVAATAGTNVDLCLITSAATPLAGVIAWVQQ